MELFLLLIRLALAGIFATAGVAKFADLKGSEKAFKEFGMPDSLALPSSIALSVFEIVIAVAFLFPETSWYSALAAAALLTLFIAQMAYQRAKGNAPDCHCFGQLHSEPVSSKSIVRNGIFLGFAVIPLLRGFARQGLRLEAVTLEMMPTILGTAALIMLGGGLLYLRRIAQAQDELKRRIELLSLLAHESTPIDHEHASDPQVGLPIGSPLPNFELQSINGDTVSLKSIKQDGKPVIFFFISPTCEPCQILLPDFVEWAKELAGRVSVVFFSSGDKSENEKKFRDAVGSPVLLDDGRQFAKSVGGRWTPTALLVDANGRVASHVAAGDLAIEDLVEKIKRADLNKPFTYFPNADHPGRGLKMGNPAPDFSLADVNGQELSKRDLLGKKTLVTFWSPTCPHCEAFLDELKAWEAATHNGDPQLVLISDGEIDQHQDLGLRAPVLMDKGYRVAAKLGMFGTPSAVLLDENGIITTETGIGSANIWALIGRRINETN